MKQDESMIKMALEYQLKIRVDLSTLPFAIRTMVFVQVDLFVNIKQNVMITDIPPIPKLLKVLQVISPWLPLHKSSVSSPSQRPFSILAQSSPNQLLRKMGYTTQNINLLIMQMSRSDPCGFSKVLSQGHFGCLPQLSWDGFTVGCEWCAALDVYHL